MISVHGELLDDRYELQELIAAGGMGEVWRGRDVRFDRPVAVKVLRSEYADDPISPPASGRRPRSRRA